MREKLVVVKVSLVHQGLEILCIARGEGGCLVTLAHDIVLEDEYKHKLIQNLKFLTARDMYYLCS